MGKRQQLLEDIASGAFGKGIHPWISGADFERSGLYPEILRVYRNLGGLDVAPKLKPGGWDIPLKEAIIELDEENHFNRYRLTTLESPIYQNCNSFNLEGYRSYCHRHELRCVTSGNYWDTPSAARQFGQSNPTRGNLSGGGSSRWKQRAFNDFLKDAYSIITGVPVIRISIYDTFRNHTIGELLKRADTDALEALLCTLLPGN